jgi:hypothetical protein
MIKDQNYLKMGKILGEFFKESILLGMFQTHVNILKSSVLQLKLT